MSRDSIRDHRAQGGAIIERFGALATPKGVKPSLKRFTEAHEGYEAGCVATDAAREMRDKAVDDIGGAHEALDRAPELLARKMTGAGLGTRRNAFEGFSKYAPSDLEGLAYADELRESRGLVKAVKAKRPPREVLDACASCLTKATALEQALGALTRPQAAFTRAHGARDALLPGWVKAFNSLKKQSNAAWEDEPATVVSLFAPAPAVQAPKKKRAKKSAAVVGESVAGAAKK